METIERKCAKSTELPKELLSTITLTTHLLPTNVTRSHREHPPDNGNNRSQSHNRNWSSACTTSSFKCDKNKQKLLQHQENTTNSTELHVVAIGGANNKCKIIATFPTVTSSSATAILPAFNNVSHRKNKCNSNNRNSSTTKTKTVAAKVLRQNVYRTEPTAATVAVRCKATAAATTRAKFRLLPSLGTTSFFTLLTLVCLETVLLSTVSNCAKTFYMHWNTSNSIFRIDNTDHIIDVNKGNLAFEFDQVHIICPVYEPGTFENETEKYIIYNVSKVEYETCRITNADPRVIAICDKPQKLMFFTITFRPFTPQPGGLEFLPGNDYYFISTSSKDDLYRRIGGRCSTNNMKVVFKVCCASEDKNKTTTNIGATSSGNTGGSGNNAGGSGVGDTLNVDINTATSINQQQHHHTNNINTIGINGVNTGLMPSGSGGVQLKPINGQSGTSINTNIDQFNRIPLQTGGGGINVIGNNMGGVGLGSHGGSGIMLTPGHGVINMIPTGSGGIGQYPGHTGQTGIRINNVPSQHNPAHKNNNDDHYDKHPNEVVKNEELTYISAAAATIHQTCCWWPISVAATMESLIKTTLAAEVSSFQHTIAKVKHTDDEPEKTLFNLNSILFTAKKIIIDFNFNPIIMLYILLILITHKILKYSLLTSVINLSPSSPTSSLAAKSSYMVNKSYKSHEKIENLR